MGQLIAQLIGGVGGGGILTAFVGTFMVWQLTHPCWSSAVASGARSAPSQRPYAQLPLSP
jgi:hypothetical protein